jgi:hypothetical protein
MSEHARAERPGVPDSSILHQPQTHFFCPECDGTGRLTERAYSERGKGAVSGALLVLLGVVAVLVLYFSWATHAVQGLPWRPFAEPRSASALGTGHWLAAHQAHGTAKAYDGRRYLGFVSSPDRGRARLTCVCGASHLTPWSDPSSATASVNPSTVEPRHAQHQAR